MSLFLHCFRERPSAILYSALEVTLHLRRSKIIEYFIIHFNDFITLDYYNSKTLTRLAVWQMSTVHVLGLVSREGQMSCPDQTPHGRKQLLLAGSESGRGPWAVARRNGPSQGAEIVDCVTILTPAAGRDAGRSILYIGQWVRRCKY